MGYPKKLPHGKEKGWTLIEILTTLGILAILAAIIVLNAASIIVSA